MHSLVHFTKCEGPYINKIKLCIVESCLHIPDMLSLYLCRSKNKVLINISSLEPQNTPETADYFFFKVLCLCSVSPTNSKLLRVHIYHVLSAQNNLVRRKWTEKVGQEHIQGNVSK